MKSGFPFRRADSKRSESSLSTQLALLDRRNADEILCVYIDLAIGAFDDELHRTSLIRRRDTNALEASLGRVRSTIAISP